MSNVERAVSCFEEGFMCSQAVLSAYSEQFGLPREVALRLSETFGGGMAGMGKTCGAVTGALMVIGLKYGRVEAGDEQAKQKARETVWEFVKEFRSRHATITCSRLLNCDISTQEGYAFARDNGLFTTLCPAFVRDAAEIVEQMVRD